MRLILNYILRAIIMVVLLGQTLIVQADGDHDEARRLLESGDILSLEVILDKLQPRYPGRIIEVEIERKYGRIVYEIEIVGEDGVVHEVYVDAKTGDVLHSKKED